jgi:hypothetical protein
VSQPLFDALFDCMCAGPCSVPCAGSVCFGEAASESCAGCAVDTTMGCGEAFSACAADD